jgi:hypothetical protein
MPLLPPHDSGTDWIDQLTDSQCMEVFWLYVDPPEPFLARYPAALLGRAMRHALRQVAAHAAADQAARETGPTSAR